MAGEPVMIGLSGFDFYEHTVVGIGEIQQIHLDLAGIAVEE